MKASQTGFESFPGGPPTGRLHVAALAGGVGGARLADGLAQVLPADCLTVIVNVGDDFEHLGLKICPDLDTVCYMLAGLLESGYRMGAGRRDLAGIGKPEGARWAGLVPPGRR